MKKQYVVFGVDRFGASVAITLENAGCQVIAVDHNAERIQKIADEVSYAMTADVEDQEAMASLGLKNVDGAVITMTDHMEASIVAAMICKEFGVQYVIAQAKNDMHRSILEKIGVDKVVQTEVEMGNRIGKYLTAQDFSDWITLSPEFSLVEINIPAEWIGKSLIELRLREIYHLNVIGVNEGGEMSLQPDPKDPLKANSVLYLVGKNEDLDKFQEKK